MHRWKKARSVEVKEHCPRDEMSMQTMWNIAASSRLEEYGYEHVEDGDTVEKIIKDRSNCEAQRPTDSHTKL